MDPRERLRRIFEGLIPASALDGAVDATEAIGEPIAGEAERVSPEMFGGLDSEGRAVIRVWGPIVSDGSWQALDLAYMGFPFSTPARFGAALTAAREAGATDVVLRISSAGGSLSTANAMLLGLREWRNQGGTVSLAVLEAWVASAATVVMLGASRIVCGPLTEVLIHFARITVMGAQAQKLRDLADGLDEANGEIVRLYVSARELDEATVRSKMEAETQIVGQKIVDFGLADEVLEIEPPDEPGPTAQADEPGPTAQADEPVAEPPPAEPTSGDAPEDPPAEPVADPPQIQDGADAGDAGEPSDPPAVSGEEPGGSLIGSRLRRHRRLRTRGI